MVSKNVQKATENLKTESIKAGNILSQNKEALATVGVLVATEALSGV